MFIGNEIREKIDRLEMTNKTHSSNAELKL